MQVTVIPTDNVIMVDGKILQFSYETPANIHAIQWNGNKGYIEYTDSKHNKELSGEADYIVHILPYVDLWEMEKQRLETAVMPPVEPTLTEVVTTKYTKIISGANAALNEAQSCYSLIEIGTWLEQETGAITIKGLDTSVATKAEVVTMLNNPMAVEQSIARVRFIAENKGITPEELSDRILNNAQTARELIDRILKQQNGYEKQLQSLSDAKEGETEADLINRIQNMVIDYSDTAEV